MNKTLHRLRISRRSFLSVAAATGLSIYGCKEIKNIPVEEKSDEKWVTVACWHNCGSRCLNKVLVSDGVVISQKSDDTHPDSINFPQQRSCLKGRSQHKQVFSNDRLRYPMVRKNWKPSGGGDKSLRGRDEWQRISWDEAFNLIVSELKRVKKDYGNRSIMVDDNYTNTEYKRPLAAFGGFVDTWTTVSYGSWCLTPMLCGYGSTGAMESINDRMDFHNCDTIIFMGCNPAWTATGAMGYIFRQAKKEGKEFIGIDPVYNETYAVLGAKWLPVRPVTDHALLLGVAHTLITEDEPDNNPLIDWEFLKNNTVGFDADTMPEETSKKDNFKDYVLGTYDNLPKDAKWASERCGIDEEEIKLLARKMGMKNKVAFLVSWAVARSNNTDNLPQLCMTIGAMTGHMGKSGHMSGMCAYTHAANNGPMLVKAGSGGLSAIINPVEDCVAEPEHWNALAGKPFNFVGNPPEGKWRKCEKRKLDIKFILTGMRNRMQTRLGLKKGLDTIRSNVDCIVAPAQFLSNNAMYADIVLPVSSWWERQGLLTGNREILIAYSKVTEPMFESKSDLWIVRQLAERLGFPELYPMDDKQIFFNKLAGSQVINSAGDGYEPLCTITAQDIKKWGVQGAIQQGRITIDEFIERGVYQVPRKQGDNYGYIAFEKFRQNPEKYPVGSKSGKLEIYSAKLAEVINAMQYSSIKPIPTYKVPVNGYEYTFKNWAKKIKGEYPYQMVTMHYIKRSHTVFENIAQLGEAFKSPVLISAADAQKEGIITGNTVLVYNKSGQTLRTALVSQRVMPGCIVMFHGGWSDIDEDTGIDYGGSDNVLTSDVATGQGTAGYNSVVVNIKKYSDSPLLPDCQKLYRKVNL